MKTSARFSTHNNAFRLLKEGADQLQQAGISNASFEARELLAQAVGVKPLDLVLMSKGTPSAEQTFSFRRLLKERLDRKPLAYVIGEWDFATVKLRLTRDTLVPRPETEELFEWAFSRLSKTPDHRIVDVGTGSGCLAIALAKAFPDARVFAIDISATALSVASENARLNGVSAQIEFVEADLLFPLIEKGHRVSAVVANLPYIPTDAIPGLEPEVLWEPRLALDGGPDGLALVRRLAPQAKHVLESGGFLMVEVGHDQGAQTGEIFKRAGFDKVETKTDFNAVERFVGGFGGK